LYALKRIIELKILKPKIMGQRLAQIKTLSKYLYLNGATWYSLLIIVADQ